MARDISAITTLTAHVAFTSSAHLGATSPLVGDAAPLLRDVAGSPLLPGTSVAGVLRARLGARGTDPALWGGTEADRGGASRVVVHDAVVEPLTRAAVSRRDGVAIDRAWGSAVDTRLYARETIPAGSVAVLRVEVHSTIDTEPADRELLAAVQALLKRGDAAFGARTRRGLGRVELVHATVAERRFDTAAEFWATRTMPRPVTLPKIEIGLDDAVRVEITWTATTPVIVAADQAKTLPRLPLMEPDPADPERLRQLVPGTSLAGALRSRAETICRTLAGPTTPGGFDAQLASTPLVMALFGGPAGEQGSAASAVSVDDCASVTTVKRVDWLKLLTERRERHTPASDGAELLLTDHVAVDRWTGGAAYGRLFTVAEPHGFRYQPIRLRLDCATLPDADRDAATMLLLVTLREFAEGRIPLGSGTHRGSGAVAVSRIRISGGGLDIDSDRLDLTTEPLADLRTAWREWISSQQPESR